MNTRTTTIKKKYSVYKTIERSAVMVSGCEGATLLENGTVLISVHDIIVAIKGYGVGLTEM